MYFCNMFCYGDSRAMTGITGIMGCLGVIYVGKRSSYAIHIPPDKRAVLTEAGKTFVRFVTNHEGSVGGNGHLFGFINGKNRNNPDPKENPDTIGGEEELLLIKKGLGGALSSPKTTVYRITKNLGPNSGGFNAASVAIMLERVHASGYFPDGCAIYYKPNSDITWVASGEPPTGQYKPNPGFLAPVAPNDLRAGWIRASDQNCTLTKI